MARRHPDLDSIFEKHTGLAARSNGSVFGRPLSASERSHFQTMARQNGGAEVDALVRLGVAKSRAEKLISELERRPERSNGGVTALALALPNSSGGRIPPDLASIRRKANMAKHRRRNALGQFERANISKSRFELLQKDLLNGLPRAMTVAELAALEGSSNKAAQRLYKDLYQERLVGKGKAGDMAKWNAKKAEAHAKKHAAAWAKWSALSKDERKAKRAAGEKGAINPNVFKKPHRSIRGLYGDALADPANYAVVQKVRYKVEPIDADSLTTEQLNEVRRAALDKARRAPRQPLTEAEKQRRRDQLARNRMKRGDKRSVAQLQKDISNLEKQLVKVQAGMTAEQKAIADKLRSALTGQFDDDQIQAIINQQLRLRAASDVQADLERYKARLAAKQGGTEVARANRRHRRNGLDLATIGWGLLGGVGGFAAGTVVQNFVPESSRKMVGYGLAGLTGFAAWKGMLGMSRLAPSTRWAVAGGVILSVFARDAVMGLLAKIPGVGGLFEKLAAVGPSAPAATAGFGSVYDAAFDSVDGLGRYTFTGANGLGQYVTNSGVGVDVSAAPAGVGLDVSAAPAGFGLDVNVPTGMGRYIGNGVGGMGGMGSDSGITEYPSATDVPEIDPFNMPAGGIFSEPVFGIIRQLPGVTAPTTP